MSRTLIRGENLLLIRPLYAVDQITPLLVSNIASAAVTLSIGNTVVKKFVHGTDPELRADGTSSYVLEITSALSATMTPGTLKERWELVTANAAFVVDGGTRHDIVELAEVLVQ